MEDDPGCQLTRIVHDRVLHYYGQRGARLNRNETIHDMVDPRLPSYIFLLASPLLFFEPDVYLRKLYDMYVDEMINEVPWTKFWDDMRRDWERATTPVRIISAPRVQIIRFISQVTVLLSTNVGLLAIGSIDQPNNMMSTHRSVAQVASYVSTVLSLACYLICWILSRQHPPGSHPTAAAAVRWRTNPFGAALMLLIVQIKYLSKRQEHMFGLEADALIYR